MKLRLLSLCVALFATFSSKAQTLCPGGGDNFSSAILWDASWTVGCVDGASCTGGTKFDNRAACERATAMDLCAPDPSCSTSADDASDLWFEFFASATTATINVNPSVSMQTGIQVFSGGPTCGGLTEIGCNAASSTNSNAIVNLTGLT